MADTNNGVESINNLIKNTYGLKRALSTFNSSVMTLLYEFLPERETKYVLFVIASMVIDQNHSFVDTF